MLVIPPELRQQRFAFLVNAPENVGHSNGIRVLLDAAGMARAVGLDVCIVPAHTSTSLYKALPEPYADLPISWDVPKGCCALLGDTLSADRLQETRARAKQICHYSLAPNGLFQGDGTYGNRLLLKPGERQAVYSPMISTRLPAFYLQPHFAELEPYIQTTLAKNQHSLKPARKSQLKACIYAGKGYLKPLDPQLRQRISRKGARLFTRFAPASKQKLYEQLVQADLLVSFDPISSLAYEASLLGIPTLIEASWDEPNFQHNFPVLLDGVVWSDRQAFLQLLHTGFDQQAVVSSYRAAINRNQQTMVELLSFASGHQQPQDCSAVELNNYWQSRQLFFAQLNLPSPSSAWGPISVALTPANRWEHVQDAADAILRPLLLLGRKLTVRGRVAGKRLLAHLFHPFL
jgi:hypothetical protein